MYSFFFLMYTSFYKLITWLLRGLLNRNKFGGCKTVFDRCIHDKSPDVSLIVVLIDKLSLGNILLLFAEFPISYD